MSTERASISSDYPLEGILREGGRKAGVVICHPHPLYGGNMYNTVIDAIDEGFFAKGYTTLRFNFRGVGMSGGVHDEGEGEVKDVIAALAYLRQNLDGDAHIIIAGYSFGARMASMAAAITDDIDGLFLVAYPFAYHEPDELKSFNKRIYLVGGEYDDRSPLDTLLRIHKDMPSTEKIVKIIATDHFFSGKRQEITDFIKENI